MVGATQHSKQSGHKSGRRKTFADGVVSRVVTRRSLAKRVVRLSGQSGQSKTKWSAEWSAKNEVVSRVVKVVNEVVSEWSKWSTKWSPNVRVVSGVVSE